MTNDVHRVTPNRLGAGLITVALLIVILIIGAWLRLVGLDWDDGHLLHPDERFLVWVVADIQPATSWAEYFDTLHTKFNPNNVGHGFYVYGDWPVFLLDCVGQILNRTAMYELASPGRALSATADLVTVILLFLLGRHLFDRRVGLVAAGLYAVTGFAIQQSHFFTVDTFTTLFVVASMYFAARALTAHRWSDYLMFGLMLGLAMSSKVSVFPLALILVLALAVRVWREREDLLADRSSPPVDPLTSRRKPTSLIVRAAAGLLIAGIAATLTFRLGQPYAFLPPNSGYPIEEEKLGPAMSSISVMADPLGFRPNPLWLDQMAEVRQQVSGYSDIPPNHQWGKRLPLVFPWVNMVRVGMGWPLGLWCWFAFFWAVWEIVRGHPRSLNLLLPVVWVGVYYTWQGIGWVKTMRYFLPVYPFLILLGAWAIWTIWDRIQFLLASRGAPRWHVSARAAAVLGGFVILSAFLWGFAVSRIYSRPVTRVAASEWIYENIPSDVTLLLETPDGPATFNAGLPNNWPAPIPQEQEDPRQPPGYSTYLERGIGQRFPLQVTVEGTLTGLRLTHVIDADHLPGSHRLRVAIATNPDELSVITSGEVVSDFEASSDPRGGSYDVEFDTPVSLASDRTYWLILQPYDTNLIVSGSSIATEGAWDDPLPLPMSPYYTWSAQFQGYEFQMAWEDTVDKRLRMEYILDHADYIVISSNRFYDSLRRNPRRFPLSIAYYRALFSGELGFRLVRDLTSRPNLGPIEFYDDDAEEAWTVYDHPHVLIFQKTDVYNPVQTSRILDAVDLTNVERVIAKDAQGWPVDLPMPELESSAGLPARSSGPASDVPPPGLYRDFQPLAVIVWYAYIAIVGWAAFPLLFTIFPALPDRGYAVSRIVGMLFTAWLGWLLASLEILPWSGAAVVVSLVILALASLLLVRNHRAAFVAWLRAERAHVLTVEAIIAALFLFFLLVRLGNPDLWHPYFGGEKPMDLSYFNAVLNSRNFPPYDPWFSGGTINYYYFGFVIVGAPVKVTGIPVTVAYNLILPTLYAITGIGAFSAAYNLLALPAQDHEKDPEVVSGTQPEGPSFWRTLRAWPRVSPTEVFGPLARTLNPRWLGARRKALAGGFAALVLAVVLGNLDEIRTLIWGLANLGAGEKSYNSTYLPDLTDLSRGISMVLFENQPLHTVALGDWYWSPTRLIPVPLMQTDTGVIEAEIRPITEFPFFTFLYADLHAHMIAMPVTLLAINWCIAQIRGARAPATWRNLDWLIGMLFGGLTIGALRPTNTWDWPTYLALGVGALGLAHATRRSDRYALPALGVGAIFALASAGTVMLLNGPLIASAGTASPSLTQTIMVMAIAAGAVAFVVGYGLGVLLAQSRTEAHADTSVAPLQSWRVLIEIALQCALLAGLTVVLFLPFIQRYRLGYTTAVLWRGSKTPIWAYLDIHGLFLFLAVSWLVWETWNWVQVRRAEHGRIRRAFIIPMILVLVLILGAGIALSRLYPVALIAVPIIVWSVALFFRPTQSVEKRAVLMLLILALALTLTVEVVVLQGDIHRMNTVFKFYLQVWFLLAVVGGASLGWLWPVMQRARRGLRSAWISALAILVFLGALYPLLATRAKIADRWMPDVPLTLDGMAYMQYAERAENGRLFSLKPDYEALRWLQENVSGRPTVLEAYTTEYNWGARVAVYTGLPSVIGWNWHQRQQRPNQDAEVWQRATDVQTAYNTPDIRETLSILRHYGVQLIVVGELERAYYTPEGLHKFDVMAEQGLVRLVYERDGTKIYQVVDSQESASWSP